MMSTGPSDLDQDQKRHPIVATAALFVTAFVGFVSLLPQLDRTLDGLRLFLLSLVGALGVAICQRAIQLRPLRWIHWVAIGAGSLLAASVVVTPVLDTAGGPRATELTWAGKSRLAQQRIDALRIGMPLEEISKALGTPRGRYVAPPNPFGVERELIFVDDLVLIQLLLNKVNAVEYYAVTTIDAAFQARTPLYSCRDVDDSAQLVLNRTTVAELDCVATVFGLLGASYFNFGFSWGGAHANGWRYSAAGVSVFGNRRFRGAPIDEVSSVTDPARSENLYKAFGAIVEHPEFSQDDWDRWEARRKTQCLDEMLENDYGRSPLDTRWFRTACEDPTMLTATEQAKLQKTLSWKEYAKVGTLNTFAVTAPFLFDHGAMVFYGIWDIGPLEESIP